MKKKKNNELAIKRHHKKTSKFPFVVDYYRSKKRIKLKMENFP